MDERGHRRHHHQHDRGQRIDTQRPIDAEITRTDEIEHRHDMGFRPAGQEGNEDRPTERAGREQRARRHQFGRDVADGTVAKARDNCRQQRQEYNELDHVSPSSG